MDPLLQTILVFVGLFACGYGLCWLMDYQEMRRLRRDARADAMEIGRLKEQITRAYGDQMRSYRVDTSKAVNDAYQSGFIAGRKERELSTK